MKEYYRVQANINLDAVYDNFLHAKQLLKPETKLMAIIKADAYGHGAVEVLHLDEVIEFPLRQVIVLGVIHDVSPFFRYFVTKHRYTSGV